MVKEGRIKEGEERRKEGWYNEMSERWKKEDKECCEKKMGIVEGRSAEKQKKKKERKMMKEKNERQKEERRKRNNIMILLMM